MIIKVGEHKIQSQEFKCKSAFINDLCETYTEDDEINLPDIFSYEIVMHIVNIINERISIHDLYLHHRNIYNCAKYLCIDDLTTNEAITEIKFKHLESLAPEVEFEGIKKLDYENEEYINTKQIVYENIDELDDKYIGRRIMGEEMNLYYRDMLDVRYNIRFKLKNNNYDSDDTYRFKVTVGDYCIKDDIIPSVQGDYLIFEHYKLKTLILINHLIVYSNPICELENMTKNILYKNERNDFTLIVNSIMVARKYLRKFCYENEVILEDNMFTILGCAGQIKEENILKARMLIKCPTEYIVNEMYRNILDIIDNMSPYIFNFVRIMLYSTRTEREKRPVRTIFGISRDEKGEIIYY